MAEKHAFEQLREHFNSRLDELKGNGLPETVVADCLAAFDRGVGLALMGAPAPEVKANGPAPLTRGQKIAAARKRNAAKRAREERKTQTNAELEDES